uniref:Uncharacterized protein n=1 Tax=Nelumbo nucifera TaxID=4432 RepID=A0A822ZEP7_NELNU|nr:TPA_asm: hypothetical protein HUJ06_016198 [Nelumbo nucifera]
MSHDHACVATPHPSAAYLLFACHVLANSGEA